MSNPNTQISPNRRSRGKTGINGTTLLIFDLPLLRRSFAVAGTGLLHRWNEERTESVQGRRRKSEGKQMRKEKYLEQKKMVKLTISAVKTPLSSSETPPDGESEPWKKEEGRREVSGEPAAVDAAVWLPVIRLSDEQRGRERGEKSKVFGKGEGRRTGRRGRMKKEKEGVEYLYMYVCENYH